MSLRVYSTLTRAKEDFVPLQPGKVGIYLCGPTVYKPSHIGHMVGPIIFDVIKRYLVYSGYQTTLVVNITDVDDKLIAEANKRGLTMAQVAEEMTADYQRNLAAMGIDTIDHFPKATANMAEIIQFTQELIDRGYAYPADGDVFFDVVKDKEYGKLSGRKLEQMQGEGGGAADKKRSPLDFALWKAAKPGEPSWPSPWGQGRPGWHIECSAMSRVILGKTFDIHGGGLDLQFPHHENEIAQSECCHGQPQAKYWFHNGLVQASNEVGKVGGRNTREAGGPTPAEGDQAAQEAGKIGKSKGSGAFSELLQKFPGETIRFFILSTHYRRPIDFSEDRIREVQGALEGFYRYFTRFERIFGTSFYALPTPANRAAGELAGAGGLIDEAKKFRAEFLEAMDDDFNTGGATGVLFSFLSALNRFADAEGLEKPDASDAAKATLRTATGALREITALLGLFRQPVAKPSGGDDGSARIIAELMAELIDLRKQARASKNFALADKIRKSLGEVGVTLEDRPTGTEYSVKPLPELLRGILSDAKKPAG